MPEFEPTNSPTTAPTTASVAETFSPLKMLGSACGRLNLRNVCRREARIDRARSIMSGSIDLKPMTVATTTGKNPSRKAEITLGKIPDLKRLQAGSAHRSGEVDHVGFHRFEAHDGGDDNRKESEQESRNHLGEDSRSETSAGGKRASIGRGRSCRVPSI